MATHYEVLGIPRDADEKQIRQAFRRQARQYHPDLNPGDGDAEAKFKRINEAYEVLSDAETRKKYDRYGDNWADAQRFESGAAAQGPFDWSSGRSRSAGPGAGFGPFGDLEDLLGGFAGFGSRQRRPKPRLETTVDVTPGGGLRGRQAQRDPHPERQEQAHRGLRPPRRRHRLRRQTLPGQRDPGAPERHRRSPSPLRAQGQRPIHRRSPTL